MRSERVSESVRERASDTMLAQEHAVLHDQWAQKLSVTRLEVVATKNGLTNDDRVEILRTLANERAAICGQTNRRIWTMRSLARPIVCRG